MDNYDLYKEYLEYKYPKSIEKYDKKINENEREEIFLAYYEYHNIFPIYPKPIIISIKDTNDNYKISDGDNSEFFLELEEKYAKKVIDKVSEYQKYEEQVAQHRNLEKARRFFDYEIRDEVKNIIPDSYITNAWCKMYELLVTYNMFSKVDSDTINVFHICEHPGAFIYATRDYIKRTHPTKKYNFVFQSLKPSMDKKKIFRTEKSLLENFKQNLDYGIDGKGDITNIDNILYYAKKYKPIKFDLITSDCGLDCSDDFNQQENVLYPIYFGAFLAAVGLSKKGTTYICKMFTFFFDKTIELIYFYCLFYANVEIVRVLMTKSGSAEIYVVCRNFMYDPSDAEFQNLYNKLVQYYKIKKFSNTLMIKYYDTQYIKKLLNAAEIISMTRIMNLNLLIYRVINFDYAASHKTVRNYVKNLVAYYTRYYLNYIKLVDDLKEQE